MMQGLAHEPLSPSLIGSILLPAAKKPSYRSFRELSMSADTRINGTSTPLRRVAEALLRDGTPPPSMGGWTTGLDALTTLHSLAGSPDSARDALKLLHELQVHQVELTVQHEQLEQDRVETVEALDRYVERFDFAPMGYFAIESDGRIIESNLAGAELFELERAELEGIPVENLLADESRGILRELLQRLRNGEPDGNCLLRRIPAGGGQRLLLAQVRASSRERCVYMSLTDISHCVTSDRRS
jgi:PAS domain S-box-containing protein